jgi:hypothetical protein
MIKKNLFVAILILLQLSQVYTGGRVSFDINKSTAYLNAGNCYVRPGLTTSSNTQKIGVKFYNLPYGWKQYQDKLLIPNLLSQKGEWTFGAKAIDEGGAIN